MSVALLIKFMSRTGFLIKAVAHKSLYFGCPINQALRKPP